MRNKLLVISLLIFLFCIFSMSVYASEYKSEISVGLRYGENNLNAMTVSSVPGVGIYNAETGETLYISQPGEEVYIQMGSTGFAAIDKFDASFITKISIQSSDNIVSFDGKKYRGYIRAERTNNGELLVLNYVGTDEYVSSVLGKEMSYTWPIEALKAQAVCARNFVLCRNSAHKNYGFDVCATTHCQVYGGVESEHENTRRAVEETKGVLAKYEGKVVGLYFFATSAGQTEDVENVWGSPYGYLKSVPDTYENPQKASRYTWTQKLTRTEIEEKLKNAGVDIGNLKKITIDSKTSSGRVTGMTFYGTNGTHTVKREKCRTILGLYSQKFTVTADGSRAIVTTSGKASAPLYTLTSGGVKPLSGYSVLTANSQLSYIDTNVENAQSYTIDGGGYGHGVGMSQWGARGMAEAGFTYDQILKHYFTGIELG